MCRLFSLILIFFCSISSYSTNYYISNWGNDTNNGTNPSATWKTLAKVTQSQAMFAAGDSILFRKGDVFYGEMLITVSGSNSTPIVFSSYGTGDKPFLKGSKILGTWTSLGANIYSAPCTLCGTKVAGLYIDDIAQNIGRTPNINATNKGYLFVQSHVGRSQFMAQSLPYNQNWTGAEVVIRTQRWTLDKFSVNTHVGMQFYLAANSNIYDIKDRYGFFIQNHLATLDTQGEWYYDPILKLVYLFSTQAPSSQVEISLSAHVISLSNSSNIHIKGLKISSANDVNIRLLNNNKLVLENNDLINAARDGIRSSNCNQCTFNANVINHSQNNGIQLMACRNVVFTNNVIRNTGIKAGMGDSGDGKYNALIIDGTNYLLSYNVIDSTGYLPVNFNGDSATISYNLIKNYVMTKDDGGGLYTWNGANTLYKNRILKNNILFNAIGAGEGTDNPNSVAAEGIYMDDKSNNVALIDNTVYNCGNNGIYIHNANAINISGNTLFDNKNQLLMLHDNIAPTSPIRNCTVANNILFSKNMTQTVVQYSSKDQDVLQFGGFDNNFYCRPLHQGAEIFTKESNVNNILHLNDWQKLSNKDIYSKPSPTTLAGYQLLSIIGTNKFSNGNFNSNTNGWSCFAPSSNCLVSYEANSSITGGALKLGFSSVSGSSSNYILVTGAVGNIEISKKYILKFSLISNSTSVKTMEVILRKNGGNYQNLAPTMYVGYDQNVRNYEFLIEPSINEVSSRIDFSIPESSDHVWLDNVSLTEAQVQVSDPNTFIRFEYNANKTDKSIPLDTIYTDVKQNSYAQNITLKPYTSVILMKRRNGILPFLTASTHQMLFPAKDSLIQINIQSNILWTIVGIPSWMSIYSITCFGNADVDISTVENTFTGSRMATLSIVGILPMPIISITQVGQNLITKLIQPTYFEHISVYPNPSNKRGQVTIESRGQLIVKNIQLLNTLGVLVMQNEYQSDNNIVSIDISRFNRGVYLLKIETDNAVYNRTLIIED